MKVIINYLFSFFIKKQIKSLKTSVELKDINQAIMRFFHQSPNRETYPKNADAKTPAFL